MAKKFFGRGLNVAGITAATAVLRTLWEVPAIRETIEEASRTVANSAQTYLQRRRGDAAHDVHGKRVVNPIALRGYLRLAHRVTGLEHGLEILRTIPAEEAVEAVAILDQRLSEVKISLAVSKNLPPKLRKQGYAKVSQALAEIEQALMSFAAV